MHKYVLKRILLLIPVLLGVSLLVFAIMSLTPGDPAQLILGENAPREAVLKLREEMGLNDPFFIQYLRFVKNAILGADPEIPIPGFLIINVKRHIRSFSQLDKEERNEIGNLIVYAERALKELKLVEEVTLVQEERSKHLHIWIFPNYHWMTEKFGKGITYLREISEYAKKNSNEEEIQKVLDTIEKIKTYFKEHNINE